MSLVNLVEFDLMFAAFIKLVLHIQKLVCCFVLDGSPRLMHALWKKRPYLGSHNVELHMGSARVIPLGTLN